MNAIYMRSSKTLTYNNISILNQNIYRYSTHLKPKDVSMQHFWLPIPILFHILHALNINIHNYLIA